MQRLIHNRTCVAILLSALALLAGCEKQEELVVAPTQKQAMQILVALADRGIVDATKEQSTQDRKSVWIIRVPRQAMLQAQRVLIENDLPYEERGGLETIIDNSGIIPTKTDERARLMHAIGQELARTFESYDDVTFARVHIMIPDKPIGRQRLGVEGPKASATVLIKYASDEADTGPAPADATPADAPITLEQVRQMVAGSVEDMDPSNVTVAYTRARRHTAPAAMLAAAATSAPSSDDETAPATAGAAPQGSSMLVQLLMATGAFGLLSLVLLGLLVRSKRQAAASNDSGAALPTWSTDPSNRSIYDPSQASSRSMASASA